MTTRRTGGRARARPPRTAYIVFEIFTFSDSYLVALGTDGKGVVGQDRARVGEQYATSPPEPGDPASAVVTADESFTHTLHAEIRETIARLAPEGIVGRKNIWRIPREQDGDAREAVVHEADTWAERFWEDINPNLDDPFLRSDEDLRGEPLSFADGWDEARITDLITLFVHSDPEPPAGPREDGTVQISIDCKGADESARLSESNDELTPRLVALCEGLICQAGPTGETYEYNDGAQDQQSGYSSFPESFLIEVPASTMHERAKAMATFATWLNEHRTWYTDQELAVITGEITP